MAATIAKANGWDKTRIKSVHRLGSISAEVQAATWRTFAWATVFADGHGSLEVTRDGKTLHTFTFGPE